MMSSGQYITEYERERECPECGEYNEVSIISDPEVFADDWTCPECGHQEVEPWDDLGYDYEVDDEW